MKKFVVLLMSVSMLVLFSSAKNVDVQKSVHHVAYSDPSDHPIQPPIG
ncbi:hypothetical protein [Neobacillus sp. PS2-9]|nr:hypothetical protein [Neobacillus sp. PS2-9]WML59272.1 hypothetical protein RCG25_05590 [Neobacillus sp. PS2-9]